MANSLSSEILAVGLSNNLSFSKFIARKLDHLLSGFQPSEIVGVNDPKDILKQYCDARGIRYSAKQCKGRADAVHIIEKVNRLVMFWTGRDTHDLIFCAISARVPYKIVPVPITTVWNKDADQEFDLYIGRGGPWGNPFPIIPGTNETRDVVIEKYRQYFATEILENPSMRAQLLKLQGLRLGCHCKPSSCHGDVIAEFLNCYLDDHG